MRIYKPGNGFTAEQADTLNRTEAFISHHGDSVDRIILESMQTEYPDDGINILERKHFWDVEYILVSNRDGYKFHSRLGISTSDKDQNNEASVYPIWASYPRCFDAPRQSWHWRMDQLAEHFYQSKDINENTIPKQKIDSLLLIQGRVRLIHDKMIHQIQEKVRALKAVN